MSQRIYLDNAATSWPKPDAVYQAADAYQRDVGAAAGRGGHRSALQADRIVQRARAGVARLLGAADPSRVVFTSNCTDALNLAIQGVVRPGDHVVTTVCEHNSVLRPLHHLADTRQVTVSYVPCDADGFVSPDAVRQALQPHTRLVAVVHASNVTGAIQPLAEVADILRGHEALLLVDAAQTLGHIPLDVNDFAIDLLAAPGHKGLLGPLGTGLLYIRPGCDELLQPLRYGGTGSLSDSERQPDALPDKYEAGNLNLPALAGLDAAIRFIESRTIADLSEHHRQLTVRLISPLVELDGVHVCGPTADGARVGVVSLRFDRYDPHEVAGMLETTAGIECRAGLHCAPRMHETLGTAAAGGTLRLSPGWATTTVEIDATVAALKSICAEGI